MANREYLEPAYSLIKKFGGPKGLWSGIKVVAAVTRSDPSRVYRWMRPKEKGGTGGLIPSDRQKALLDYARENKLRVKADDFFGESRAA